MDKCVICEEETDRLEEDALYTMDGQGPLCKDCHDDFVSKDVCVVDKVNYLIVYNAMTTENRNILKNNYISGKPIRSTDDVLSIINTLEETEKVFDIKIINIIKIGG